ncbi:hypothetical protein HDU78_008747 [Chytriomyces hyalinus]|nr:hypothetical protein HDU78_008747 [Chytriomyces hyalinus]
MDDNTNKHVREESDTEDALPDPQDEGGRHKRPRLDACLFMDDALSPLSVALERQRVDRNILTSLDEDRPVSVLSNSIIDPTAFKYQHDAHSVFYSLDVIENAPPVNDADKEKDADTADGVMEDAVLAQTSGRRVASSSSPPASSSSLRIARVLMEANKKVPSVLPGRESWTYPCFSDADPRACPNEELGSLVLCRVPSNGHGDDLDAALLAAAWCVRLGLDHGWPKNYALASVRTTPPSGPRWDAYLYGHPSGHTFNSPNEFLTHLQWLCSSNPLIPCICKLCNGEPIKDTSHIQFLDPPPEIPEQLELEPEISLTYEGNEKIIPSTIDLAQISPPPPDLAVSPLPVPLKTSTILDADWGGDDSNSSSEDGSYGDSNGDFSDESESDGDDMNDDDDDDSGNESETIEVSKDRAEESNSEQDEMEREPLFPDIEPLMPQVSTSSAYRRPKKKIDASRILSPDVLTSSYTPLRKSEVAWYPSARLNFQPAPSNPDSFLQRMPMWPVLLLSHPDANSRLTTILPLPLPSSSEIQAVSTHHPDRQPPPFSRSCVRTADTPSHYTPKPTNAPTFGPRTVNVSDLVPWRQIDATPPHHNRKYMSTDHAWQRRWNRGVLQAVGASSSWEPLYTTETGEQQEEERDANANDGVSPTNLAGTVLWKELTAVRYGVEVVRMGDWVHVVLPSPFVDDEMEMKNVSAAHASAKHRMMKIDRIVFRSPAVNLLRRFDRDVVESDEQRVKQILEAQRKSGKVIVEGDVYAFRKQVGWFLVGRKRCTMRKVVMGRRFGLEEATLNDMPGGYDGSGEVDEVGGGFGQVGLVVGEGKRYWDGWVDNVIGQDDIEDVSAGKLSAKVEIVKTLEGLGSNQSGAGASNGVVDFNYEEDSDDEEIDVGGPPRKASDHVLAEGDDIDA